MPLPRPSDADILNAYRDCGNNARETARRLGINRKVVRRVLRQSGLSGEKGSRPRPTATGRVHVENGETATTEVDTPALIRTLEDAIRAAEVDTTVWHVEKFETSQWTVPLKVHGGQEKVELQKSRGSVESLAWKPEQFVQTQQYRVKVFLRRLMPLTLKAALDAVFERMAQDAPRFPTQPRRRPAGEQHMAVFGLFDAHFGKLCWAPEVGADYDLKLAERVYANAVEDLIAESAHRQISSILLPVGNDFFHMDNRDNSTLRGTRQDVDGRYAKVIAAGELAVINAVERLQEIAPVKVCWVPGNHDATTSYHLARVVWAWFRKCKRVEVDAGPCPRKYVTYGVNLLGLTHGDEPDLKALPDIMAAERPAEWAASSTREWLVGHWHASRRFVTQDTEQMRGTVVRVLRSLAGTDAWHFGRGYIHTKASRAAEVYFYGKTRGYVGHAIAAARE